MDRHAADHAGPDTIPLQAQAIAIQAKLMLARLE